MDITVKADLVSILYHRLDRFWVLFDAPGRDEKRLLDPIAAITLENARNTNQGPVFQHRNGRDPGNRIARVLDVHQAVGIHIEGNRRRYFGSIWPGHWALNHLSFLKLSRCGREDTIVAPFNQPLHKYYARMMARACKRRSISSRVKPSSGATARMRAQGHPQ
jgi:hypothetical protein